MTSTLSLTNEELGPNSYRNGQGLLLRVQCFLAVRDTDRHIACVKLKENDGWSLPGETIKPNENPDDAARRVAQMWFEIDLPLRIASVQSYPDDGEDHKWYVIFIYEADAPPAGLKILDDTEKITFVKAGNPPSPMVMDHGEVFERLSA